MIEDQDHDQEIEVEIEEVIGMKAADHVTENTEDNNNYNYN